MEQRQEWDGHVRYVIVEEYGSIFVDIYNKAELFGKFVTGRIWIWALYVKPEYRRMGYARQLLARAEKIAKRTGRQYAYLSWLESGTSKEILDFYKRVGYREVEYDIKHTNVLLRKEL